MSFLFRRNDHLVYHGRFGSPGNSIHSRLWSRLLRWISLLHILYFRFQCLHVGKNETGRLGEGCIVEVCKKSRSRLSVEVSIELIRWAERSVLYCLSSGKIDEQGGLSILLNPDPDYSWTSSRCWKMVPRFNFCKASGTTVRCKRIYDQSHYQLLCLLVL